MSGGKYKVPHFTTKGRVEEYVQSVGIPHTFVHYCFYMENLHMMLNRKAEPWTIASPTGDNKLGMVSTNDAGEMVAKIFAQHEKFIGMDG